MLDQFRPPQSKAAPQPVPMATPATSTECEEASTMTASELVYFHDAPLAHVVDYEERLHATRSEHAVRIIARTRRPHPCPTPADIPAPRVALSRVADEV